jgi:hypothetical protein
MCNQQFRLITHRNMKAANPPTNPSANKFDSLEHFLIVCQKPTSNVVEAKLILLFRPHTAARTAQLVQLLW